MTPEIFQSPEHQDMAPKNTPAEKKEADADRGDLFKKVNVMFANVTTTNSEGEKVRTVTYRGRQYKLTSRGVQFSVTTSNWSHKLLFVNKNVEGWSLHKYPQPSGSITTVYHSDNSGNAVKGSATKYSYHAKNVLRILNGAR